MATFDSVMNVLVPTLIILVVIGFLWIKTPLGAFLGPRLAQLWAWIRGEGRESATSAFIETQRIIAYE